MYLPRKFRVNLPSDDAAVRRALDLGPKLLLPSRAGGFKVLVRNVPTGRIHLCCLSDCDQQSDARFAVEVPHPQPRWRDEATGKQEMLVYTFCSPACKREFAKGTPYENRT